MELSWYPKKRRPPISAKRRPRRGTIVYDILQDHNVSGDPDNLKIKFDSITSHDLTYAGIIQTAQVSGLDKFPPPYVLTCCHNSLCAVGDTINEHDQVFGLTTCKKYGGIYLPPHMGAMILDKIGDFSRFDSPDKILAYAGLSPST